MPKQVYTSECEGFILKAENVNDIFYNADGLDCKLLIDDALCAAFAEKFSGNFNCKQQNIQTKKGIISKYLYCSCKSYRLIYKASDIQKDVNLKFQVLSKTSDPCKCSEGAPKTRNVRGQARVAIKEQMKNMTNKQIRNNALDGSSVKGALLGNLQLVKSQATIRKIRHELLSQEDEDENDILDIQSRAAMGKIPHLASLNVFPNFSAILTKDDWLLTMHQNFSKLKFTRLLLDATGGICRPIFKDSPKLLNHVLLAPISKIGSQECYLLPIAEMITNDSTGYNINAFLRFVMMRWNKVSPNCSTFTDEIGTDCSFANINAIIR